jgi:hypothetical protein
MVEKGYFAEREARATGEETTSEPNEEEAVVFGEFFVKQSFQEGRYSPSIGMEMNE